MMLAGNLGLSQPQETGVDVPITQRALGPGRAPWDGEGSGEVGSGSVSLVERRRRWRRERAGPGAARVVEEEPGAR